MATARTGVLETLAYERAAREYLCSLPLEHFMESTAQAMQRKITLASLDIVHAARPEVQVFNELLIQYPGNRRTGRPIKQVVPDNMVVIHPKPIVADGNFGIPLQPVGPFCVLEYASANNEKKDYEDNLPKYERSLRVPYYLIFSPHAIEMTLYHHNGRRYVSVKPDANERYAIPELELELGIVDNWVRYWFRGRFLPLTADLDRELTQTKVRLSEEEKRNALLQSQLAEKTDHITALEAEIARLRGRSTS